jgi:hypothetical protein
MQTVAQLGLLSSPVEQFLQLFGHWPHGVLWAPLAIGSAKVTHQDDGFSTILHCIFNSWQCTYNTATLTSYIAKLCEPIRYPSIRYK